MADRKSERRRKHENKEEENRALIDDDEKRRARELLALQYDIGRGFVYNMRLSKAYILSCILMALATLAVVLYLIIAVHMQQQPLPLWVVILDGIVCIFMVLETTVDMGFLKWKFWSSPWHVFDLLVSILCVLGWVLLLLEYLKVLADSSGFIWVALLTIRYIGQVIRIIRYLRVAAEAKASQDVVEEQQVFFEEVPTSHRLLMTHETASYIDQNQNMDDSYLSI